MTAKASAPVLALWLGLTLAGCTGSPVVLDGTTMLRYGFLTGSPTALLTGTIRFDAGCIWLEHVDVPEVRELILWPPRTGLDNSGGVLRVIDGGVTLADGDPVTMGGGQYKDLQTVQGFVGPVPSECVTSLYWLATDVTAGLTSFPT